MTPLTLASLTPFYGVASRIAAAIAETRRLMAEIDAVIESHGGWPGALGGEIFAKMNGNWEI